MWYLSFIRAVKRGLLNLVRNGWLSFTATIVMFLTLFVISFIVVLVFVYSRILNDVKGKIGINVYFFNQVSEEKILEIKQDLLKEFPEIQAIDYTSKEQALEIFKKKNEDKKLILDSLKIVGDNPLEASFNLKVDDPNNLGQLESELISGKYKEYISKSDYSSNKSTIEKLNKIINTTQKAGFFVGMLLILVAILVTINSIRLTMYTHKEEIEIMRLVGANDWFIKLPFLTEGAFYGLFASLLVVFSWYPLAFYLNPFLNSAQVSINLMWELGHRFILIFPVQILIGLLLGTISSFISIRRYLK